MTVKKFLIIKLFNLLLGIIAIIEPSNISQILELNKKKFTFG